jgi:hypothetical protein
MCTVYLESNDDRIMTVGKFERDGEEVVVACSWKEEPPVRTVGVMAEIRRGYLLCHQS